MQNCWLIIHPFQWKGTNYTITLSLNVFNIFEILIRLFLEGLVASWRDTFICNRLIILSKQKDIQFWSYRMRKSAKYKVLPCRFMLNVDIVRDHVNISYLLVMNFFPFDQSMPKYFEKTLNDLTSLFLFLENSFLCVSQKSVNIRNMVLKCLLIKSTLNLVK